MIIYPAIDIYDGKAVRLVRGDYEQMTVYNNDPVSAAQSFIDSGATALHIVDLEGARDGKPANLETIKQIVSQTNLFVQVGGGIRTFETIDKYISIGVKRIILGTAAVADMQFLEQTVVKYGEMIAVSADIKDGIVAVSGWTELSEFDIYDFCKDIENIGIGTLICTDISKDGLLSGTNMQLYRELRQKLTIKLIASGGISTIDELKTLKTLGADGAILGKALYTGNIDLKEALSEIKQI